MKLKKLLAGVSAAAMAASVMAVSASAAEATEPQTTGLEYPVYAPLTLDGRDPAEIGPKTLNFDLFALDGMASDLVSVDVTLAPADDSIGKIWGQGWFGGQFALGYNAVEDGKEEASWKQPTFSTDGTDEISQAWAAVADGGAGTDALSFTFAIPEGEKVIFSTLDEDGETLISGGVFQVSFWWGSANIVELQELTFNFKDGSEITVISTEGTTPLPTAIEGATEGSAPYANANYILTDDGIKSIRNVTYKPIREKAAADALKALQDKLTAADIDSIVDSTNAAATALTSAKDALAKIDAAIKDVADLQAALDEAQKAFDDLLEGDEADTEAFEAAKKKVADAKAALEAAKKNLDDAIKAYNAATAEQLAAKDEQIADLEAEKEALQAELDKLKADAEANAAQIEELNAQLAAKDEEIAKLNTEKADLQTKLDEAIKNGGSASDNNNDAAGDKDEVPNTGVAVAFAGLALAAAGAVVSKKRK